MKINYKQVIRYLNNFYHNHIRYSYNYDFVDKINIKRQIDYVIETMKKELDNGDK